MQDVRILHYFYLLINSYLVAMQKGYVTTSIQKYVQVRNVMK